jgi:hypothetical protein
MKVIYCTYVFNVLVMNVIYCIYIFSVLMTDVTYLLQFDCNIIVMAV